MNHSICGLVLFVVVVTFDVAGLFLDLLLLAWGAPTITDRAREYPWIGWVIVGWQVVGATALAWHLWENE